VKSQREGGLAVRDAAQATILVTGATDGLGRRVAKELAARGTTVLLHGRSPDRLERSFEELRSQTGSEKVNSYLADLSSLAAVRNLAERILSTHDRLDVLVNNAGIIARERKESKDGYELTFAVNYLSHFLLTRLLLPLLKDSVPARIVNVASAGQSPLDFSNLMLGQGYDAMKAYSQSKLAQVMFTFDLAEQMRDTGVTVNALHPASLMATKMVQSTFGYTMSTVEEGAQAVMRLAVSPEVEGVTDRYFDGTREARANRQAYDSRVRNKLWVLSELLCGRLLEPVVRR
jgi:NAD(P)-dependent dehydrogenase (short-subunit alcohol dehydrogenase family)